MEKGKARIVFLGSPEISAAALRALVANGFNIVGVVSQPDSPKGRSKIPTPSPVAQAALALGLPLHRPVRLNKDYGFVAELKPDLLLTYAYGQLLSSRVLALSANFPPLNVHASDLPRLRGASPIQTALLENDTATAVCLMEMVKAMDAGRVFVRTSIAIAPEDDFGSLSAKVSATAINLLIDKLPEYLSGELVGVAQDESKVTVCHILGKEETLLSGEDTVQSFIGKTRAFAPKPGAFMVLPGLLRIKVLKAEPVVGGHYDIVPGHIVQATGSDLVIAVSDGCVRLLTVQKEGKKALAVKAFLNGERNLAGQRLLQRAEVLPGVDATADRPLGA